MKPMKTKAEIIAQIEKCDDEKLLRNWIENARRKGETEVEEAAFKRLIQLLPKENPGTLEWDFWRTIHAFELTLTDENGRTTRLSRTRQKVQRVGVKQTLTDWALGKKETDGFTMLLERGMPELSGEAIILRHANEFDEEVRDAAQMRLTNAGVDTRKLSLT
jgi:hypothetical protein